jgi:hypothetical protein
MGIVDGGVAAEICTLQKTNDSNMKNKKYLFIKSGRWLAAVLLASFLLSACDKDKDDEKVIIVSGTGDIQSTVDKFRSVLGGQLNTTPGAVGGYREVNWDAVPDELVGKAMPHNFFNTVGESVPASRQRGLTYDPGAGEFRVSATDFIEVNNTTGGEFAAFSGNKTFANISSDLWPIKPEVPGQAVAATVRGFGIVFSDVDVANSTFLEFYNENKSLGKFFVPVRSGQSSFSFLGVYFKSDKVTSVKVGHQGTLVTGGKDVSDGGTNDLVILDNFIYDEPVKK